MLGIAADNPKQLIGGTKGSHIVVGRFEGAPVDAFYIEAEADARPLFIIPWNDQLLIGTTDIRYKDSLQEVRASRAEVDYLLAETNRVFPSARLAVGDIHYAYAGIRPLPHRVKGPESAISRKHVIKKNKAIAKGLISVVGGKLTTYRHLAEQTVDRVGKMLQRRTAPCRSFDTPLPGGWGFDAAKDELQSLAILSEQGLERLLSIYGGRATQIVELCRRKPVLNRCIDAEQTVLAAEVVFGIRDEMARTLSDLVYRRLMLGLNADQGRPHYNKIAAIAAAELAWDERRMTDELNALQQYSDSFRVVE